jgi:hypothetical protein
MRKTIRWPVSLTLLAVFGLGGLRPQVHAQGLETGLTVGAFFNNLMAKVREAEEKAIGGGIVLEIGAGGEVALAVQQAKAAYESSLNLTIAHLHADSQIQLNTLSSMVNQYTDKTYNQVSDLEDRLYGIVSILPGANNVPKLFRYSPTFTTGSLDVASPDIEFTVYGLFVDAPVPGYEPAVRVAGRNFGAAAHSTTFITFKIPSSLLQPLSNKVNTQYVAIDIPYRTGFIIHGHHDTNFTVPVSILPTRCGTIIFSITTPTPTTLRHEITSPEMFQNSAQDDIKDGGEHADMAIHRWPASAGWRIIPGTVHYKMNWHQGTEGYERDWWFSRNISTLQEAVLCFSTEHHRIGTSGKIRFQIVFTEEKDSLANNVTTSHMNFNWGDRKTFEVPSGSTWKGSFVAFDGKTTEFNGPFKDKYINVQQNGTLVAITTIP